MQRRYRIIRVLGGGGFGTVYLAWDNHLHTHVALKELCPPAAGAGRGNDPHATIEAFQHEAILLARLRHPNLPRVHDHFSSARRWYLVMDFIEGETLETFLRTTSALPSVPTVLTWGLQLCDVLEFLHSQQPPIVFRDLKPANVMRTPGDHLYLIDFGIARHFKAGQQRDTIALGSPGYAAPEQHGKAQSTPRSDIYSLGAVLHECLSGKDPSESPFHFLPLKHFTSTVPPELEKLVRRMVEIDPARRPASIAEVRHVLAEILTSPPRPSPGSKSKTQPRTPRAQSHLFPRQPGSASSFQHPCRITCLAWSPDSRQLATGGVDGTVRIWDRATTNEVCEYDVSSSALLSLAWSPDGQRIASVCQGERGIHLWHITTGKIEAVLSHHASTLALTTAFSPDGSQLAIGNRYGTIEVWDIASLRFLLELSTHVNPTPVTLLRWSRDGAFIAATGRLRYANITARRIEAVSVWEVQTRNEYALYDRLLGDVSALVWAPDNHHIATASSVRRKVHIWNARTGKRVASCRKFHASICQLAWEDNTLLVIDAAGRVSRFTTAGQRLDQREVFPPQPHLVACAPDSSVLGVVGHDTRLLTLHDLHTTPATTLQL